MKPRTILIIAWVVCMLYAYPGYMTGGSVDQLVDSRVGELTDWAPPVMTEIWRVIGFVWSGPAGMLVLQTLLVLLGAYHLLRQTLSDRHAAKAAAFVLLAPPVVATLGVIWPQAQLAAFALAAFAALRAGRRVLGLVLAAIACAVGGTLAMLPLVIGGLSSRPGWRKIALGMVAWAVVAAAGAGANAVLVDKVTHRDEIAVAAVMREHPGTQRWYVFSRVIGLHRGKAWEPMYSSFLEQPQHQQAVHHLARHSAVQKALVAFVRTLSGTWLFHPYVYAILALVLLPLAIVRRNRDAALLLGSALTSEIAVALWVAAPELRYSLWLITATLLAIALLLCPRRAPALPV